MARRASTREPLADQMYDVLLSQFMAGERNPGEPLNIGALTRELNVSQTPLREALARLERTGLVRRVALKGYSVAPALNASDVNKLMEARLVIEPAITREAGLRVTPEFLDELEETVVALDEAISGADTDPDAFREYWIADARFHDLLAERCGNEFLTLCYNALATQLQRFRLFSKRGRTGAMDAAKEHRAVLDALKARESDVAAELMRVHLMRAQTRNAASAPA